MKKFVETKGSFVACMENVRNIMRVEITVVFFHTKEKLKFSLNSFLLLIRFTGFTVSNFKNVKIENVQAAKRFVTATCSRARSASYSFRSRVNSSGNR